jgi:Arc-like DNA binding domain
MPKILLRVTDELDAEIKASADSNMRSINSELIVAIGFYLRNAPGAAYRVIRKGGKQKPQHEE